jgi:hypothetical protein
VTAVTPFQGVTITDTDLAAIDTLTITFSGPPGDFWDAAGALNYSGPTTSISVNTTTTVDGLVTLTMPNDAVATLTGSAAAITDELRTIHFEPFVGTPNVPTTLTLSAVSSDGGSAVDSKTTVTELPIYAAPPPPVVPAITGTVSGQITMGEAPIHPFAHVTISDPNALDRVTISFVGASGTLNDGSGFSQFNAGLINPTTGSEIGVQLTGTASAITSELHAITFTPARAGTTTFTLNAAGETTGISSYTGTPAIDETTSVTDLATQVGAPGAVQHGGGDNFIFVFPTLKSSPVSHPDTILGFHQGDLIDLQSLDALVVNHQPLHFIGAESFAEYHNHHPTVWGMVRDANGAVTVNVDRHLTAEMKIAVPHQALHAFDFIM